MPLSQRQDLFLVRSRSSLTMGHLLSWNCGMRGTSGTIEPLGVTRDFVHQSTTLVAVDRESSITPAEHLEKYCRTKKCTEQSYNDHVAVLAAYKSPSATSATTQQRLILAVPFILWYVRS